MNTGDTPERQAYRNMMYRCYGRHERRRDRYGGRGITVCERWRKNFGAFLGDVGPRPSPRHTLDRFPDNDGNYEPGNVRWATRTEQMNNTCRNRYLEHDGKRLNVTQWANLLGIPAMRIRSRLHRGLSVEEALSLGRLQNRKYKARTKAPVPRGRKITASGTTLTISEWAASLGCASLVIYQRLGHGWDEVLAVTTPVKQYKPRAIKINP